MVTRRVVGSWRSLRQDGTRVPAAGTITFVPSVLIRDSTTNQIVVQDPMVVQLSTAGSIDVQIQTTDQEGLNPTGWYWEVTEEITGQTVRRYQLELPAGDTFDLSAVAIPPTAVPLRPQDQYLKRLEVLPANVVNPNQPPAVDQTTTNSVAELQFDLPRAPNVAVGNVTVGTPSQGPAATSSTTAQGDARFNFRLPRSRNFQAGTTSMVNPDQPAAVTTSEDADGDIEIDFAVPRAPEVTVGTVTVFTPDQNPDVLATVTDGDVALDFGLPRAPAVTVGTVSPLNPDATPTVSSTETDGDVALNFGIPEAPAVTVDTPATVVNPDQNPSVSSTTTDGNVAVQFSIPRAPTVTVETPATVLDPDQQPAVSSTTTDGDIEIAFSLPAAPTFAVGAVSTVGPETAASATDVGTNGNIVIDFGLPRGEKGWAPILAVVVDSARRVLQVDDWTGGEGTKPATGDYIGPTGLVADIAEAVNIRGEAGASTTDGLNDLSDVIITTVVDGQVLFYDNASGNWINKSLDTDDIPEGSTNLYYTDVRAEAAADARIAAADTDDLAEGAVNLYYTDARVDAVIAASDTDDLAEGAVNLYYTDARAEAVIAASDTDDLSEGAVNLYYTDARAEAAADSRIAAADTDDLTEGPTNLYYTDTRVLNVAVDKAGDTMTGLLTAPNFYIEVGTAASNTIDFDFDEETAFISRGATGDIVFTGSNYIAGGIKSARIVNGGTLRTVSFPAGWTFVGVKPSDIAANKTGILTVTSFSTTEGECVASWAVEF